MTDIDAERERRHRLYRGIQKRQVPAAMNYPYVVAQEALGSLGAIESVTICEDPAGVPPDFRNRQECAVCGEKPSDSERQPATLEVRIERRAEIGVGVWVHPACLELCSPTGEQRGIPW